LKYQTIAYLTVHVAGMWGFSDAPLVRRLQPPPFSIAANHPTIYFVEDIDSTTPMAPLERIAAHSLYCACACSMLTHGIIFTIC
jgi:hypothetical protein